MHSFCSCSLASSLALIGIVLSIGGTSLLRVTFIPIAFLVFAIPLPYFIDTELSFRLQLISSELGVFFIRMFGVPVYLTGNVIDFGNYKLQVVEACSGLRYLYPLLSLGFLAAYLFQAPFWQRTLVFLSAIPITIVMNSFRIAMVGLLVDRWGTAQAEGCCITSKAGSSLSPALRSLPARFSCSRGSGPARGFFEVFSLPKVTGKFAASDCVADRPTALPVATCLSCSCVAGVVASTSCDSTGDRTGASRFVTFPANLGQWQGQAVLAGAGR